MLSPAQQHKNFKQWYYFKYTLHCSNFRFNQNALYNKERMISNKIFITVSHLSSSIMHISSYKMKMCTKKIIISAENGINILKNRMFIMQRTDFYRSYVLLWTISSKQKKLILIWKTTPSCVLLHKNTWHIISLVFHFVLCH